ncbi:DUF871 domain-containing protein [Lacticaseibacillus zeae]|uniref:MupG family TIM beta-alpha barrel fold protein n=1 Tax=Lacticaseibacillus zeae subsp. silagei TaxID=3068307 RepID=A0ABD7ZAQ9_LACZE|nr:MULTISPECIES: MupG family TIM beta-alpha barrel fold protein [Lacticaseibacillus]MDE3316295.1 MupG family TIM beta-alpha barrel fold protein [Lacticaseibacillus zeae]OFR90409.1 cell surface protein [Lactobacillus sp. HMSC068F07]WLV83822.1 MupG family TIM beta-alpha barrel fold protein [Lacticaseibacillus sp. NCIMB 15475]WLV86578.1 MupG family TIM beta-alpha barrel fold protein [Lacticaseibacillus sp. NCIMB 15474]
MIGFSCYLSEPADEQQTAYLKQMQQAGFTGVFTSLQLPEDDPKTLRQRLNHLITSCHQLGLAVVADISLASLKRLGIAPRDCSGIEALQLDGVRIDDGIDMTTVAALSHTMGVALNASTLSAETIDQLANAKANLRHIEAWHNFYPRPETGLDPCWFQQKNHWLHTLGFKTMAFIPGDAQQRGPLFAGLPTLEPHRGLLPLAAYLDLKRLATDHVYIGDPQLSPRSIAAFQAYTSDQVLLIQTQTADDRLYHLTWHNRPDVAQQVVRLAEARLEHIFAAPEPHHTDERPRGSITLDNTRYGRYAGELQITRCDLPADPKVNVIGHVAPVALPLLDHVGPHQALRFKQ